MQYDGAYATQPDGSLTGAVQYVLPAGVSLITGAPAGVAPTKITTNLTLPADFADGRIITIETPLNCCTTKRITIVQHPRCLSYLNFIQVA
ncbi:MAG: hypothetical protein WA303_04750 [Bradyrhizobium sp.]|jgi:hypothetical protein